MGAGESAIARQIAAHHEGTKITKTTETVKLYSIEWYVSGSEFDASGRRIDAFAHSGTQLPMNSQERANCLRHQQLQLSRQR